MTKIYLIRHAEAEGNLYRRIHGWYDSLITPDGHRQIAALQARFDGVRFDAVYSSDLYRARTTAAAIYAPRNLPLHVDADLREVHMGDWEDLSWGKVALKHPDAYAAFVRFSDDWYAGGDTFPRLRARLERAFFRIAAAHPNGTVAIVSHGTAIRTLLGILHGYTGEELQRLGHSDNTAVSCVTISSGAVRVLFEDDNAHLPASLSTLAKQRWWREQGSGVKANLWFRPLDMVRESDFFREARREAWQTVHGSMRHFDGDGFLREAREQAAHDPRAVWCAMLEQTPAGVLHLNLTQESALGVGRIPFLYLIPEMRRRSLGVQLLGQAISVFRPLGRKTLRLRCAPDNDVAQRFYARYGFSKIGSDPGSRVPLDLLELNIEVPK